jgi:hypothetical protein
MNKYLQCIFNKEGLLNTRNSEAKNYFVLKSNIEDLSISMKTKRDIGKAMVETNPCYRCKVWAMKKEG